MNGDNCLRAKVWVNDDLMTALQTAGDLGSNTVAVGLWHRLERARDKCRCKQTGFVWDGWTRIDLTEPEHHLLKALRPSCFKPEDA